MGNGTDDEIQRLHDLWRAGEREDRGWFVALRAPMTQAARAGIRRMTGVAPQQADVDDAVHRAFLEFRDADPHAVRTPLGLARRIAFRRGQDAGRRLNRIKEFAPGDESGFLSKAVEEMAASPEDELIAAERAAHQAKLAEFSQECLEQIPPGQAEVVRATVLGDQELSDWANEKGKSYQAADQQRVRALAALLRCVESKLDDAGEGDDYRV